MKVLMLAVITAFALSCTSKQESPAQLKIAVDTLDSIKVDSVKIDTLFPND